MSRAFGSDNHAPVHPTIFASLQKVNEGHAPSYGTDPITLQAIEAFQHHFGSQSQVYFVFNGTAANVLALQAITSGYQSVLCSDVAHIHVDECAAPEFSAHVKLLPRPSLEGKMQWTDLQTSLIRRGDQHFSQIKAISLTQPTELGTTYSLAEVQQISDWAHANQLYVHMDGARLANAVISLKTTFRKLCTDLKIDVVSFGGTKNGLMMGEAVIVLNPQIGEHFRYRRKQLGQLPSKTRYIACQFLSYFENDLWAQIATHSLAMAQHLREAIRDIPGVIITIPTDSNAVFAQIPKNWLRPLRDKHFFYVWNESTLECRLMTSWDTQEEEINDFSQLMRTLAHP
jgi:threonine aldolase